MTGVWVGDRKLGAIGVQISRGVASHGLAFNLDPDLSHFEGIVACGLEGKEAGLSATPALIAPDMGQPQHCSGPVQVM